MKLFLFLVMLSAFLPDSDCTMDSCGKSPNPGNVTIPKGMSMKNFEDYYAGRIWYEFYYGVTNPLGYEIWINALFKMEKINGSLYRRTVTGDTISRPGHCEKVVENITVVKDNGTAMFARSNGELWVMYSSCLGRYMWLFVCNDWAEKQQTCPFLKSKFVLMVNSDKRNGTALPMENMSKDLEQLGVSLSTLGIDWTFSYGTEGICNIGDPVISFSSGCIVWMPLVIIALICNVI